MGKSDKFAFGANSGKGGERYLLGLPAGSAGFLDVVDEELELLRSSGAFATFRHVCRAGLRSTAAYGRAWVGDAPWQTPESFDSSTFALLNLLWSPLYYVTLGVEYQYGTRETKDGGSVDNERIILGVQIF